MGEKMTVETSITDPPDQSRELTGFVRSLACGVFLLKLATATTRGGLHCFLAETAATQIAAGMPAESSTGLRELAPELKAKLETMLDLARNAIIEDGMYNPVNERLPDLVARDFEAVIAALWSVIAAERTTPIIAAEVLKELGGLRNATSHARRRWVLERALRSPWPFTRDGAGLGLARLGDPNAIPALRRAAENEPSAEIRSGLHLVIDELAEMVTDGTPPA